MNPVFFEKLDIEPDSVLLFNRLFALPGSILLDSGMIVEGLSRYSFMSADPFMIITSRGNRVKIVRRYFSEGSKIEIKTSDPLDVIKDMLNEYKIITGTCPSPFPGGAAGYMAYDLGRQFEKLPEIAGDDLRVPDCWLGFYDLVVTIDHLNSSVYITSTGYPQRDPINSVNRARQRIRWMKNQLLASGKGNIKNTSNCYDSINDDLKTNPSAIISGFDRKGYCNAVERAKEYIAAGDIFQVNLSQRFSLAGKDRPWDVFRKLRKINPAPMAAYVNSGDLHLVSSSPERFMKVSGRLVETRPIKGTRPRGKTLAEDMYWRDDLWKSDKDRAELVMIVDLERNDLGRVCVPGSIKVTELYRLEEYSTVFHLVATVQGKLEEHKSVIDLLRASFPGGSITGAPKIRAMEVIEELEPVRRGVYCGSIGYMAFNGDADFNIVIRTLVFKRDRIIFQVGGGITIDSDPHSEYTETLDKAKALVMALGLGLEDF